MPTLTLKTVFAFSLLCLVSCITSAKEPVDTDWLETTPGSEGQLIGATILEVERQDDMTVIDIALPDNYLDDIDVIKIQKKDKTYLAPLRQPSTLTNEDGSPYGVRLYLKKVPGFEFRLRLYDENLTERD